MAGIARKAARFDCNTLQRYPEANRLARLSFDPNKQKRLEAGSGIEPLYTDLQSVA
jgi:hypothetical protein